MQILDTSKELRLLLAFFGDAQLPECEEVSADQVPEPYATLLVHDNHMTVTLEQHHSSQVRVLPYVVHRNGDFYGRKLDLLANNDTVVLTGAMLINLSFCTEKVRNLIIEEKTPLGRILIENNILRQIQATSFLRFAASDPLIARFRLTEPRATYGRLATIFCDEKPAVDLLEIVRPE